MKFDIVPYRERSNFFVVQSNDLSKLFGNLNTLEHKLLDYCFSYVKKEDKPTQEYFIEIKQLKEYLGYELGGKDYKEIFKAFDKLESETAFYHIVNEEDGQYIEKGRLLKISMRQSDGTIKFKFTDEVSPYVFDLKENYYFLRLSDLTKLKSKYSIILIKLLEAERYRENKKTEITLSLDEVKLYFLGAEVKKNPKKWTSWTASRIKQGILDRAAKEINTKFEGIKRIEIENIKLGRSVVGYKITYYDTGSG